MEIEEKKVSQRKGNTVLLTIIAVATLLVAVIGATFAYFSVSIQGNENATSVIVKTATLGIKYDKGDDISMPNAMPTDSETATFTITSNGDVDMTYTIEWVNVINEFDQTANHHEELVFTLVGTGTGATSVSETPAPLTDGTMATATIAPEGIHSYSLTLLFKEMGSEQNYNQDKAFSAKIQIEADSVTP